MIPKGIVLDSTTKKLEVTLAAAGALPVTVNYIDITGQTKPDYSAYKPATKLSTTNGTNAVTICESPAQGVVRVINYICIYDADAGAETVNIILDDNGTDYQQAQISLAATESAVWTPESSWQVVT